MKKNSTSVFISMLFLQWISFQTYAQIDENVFRNASNVKSKIASEVIMDENINFNLNWKFMLGELTGFYVPGYNDSTWRTLDVPHDWSVEGKFDEQNPAGSSGGFLPTGIGCYRKHFLMPEGSKGKRVKIRFDGVYMNSSVYLNGVFLGNRPYGFSTFEYDLTPHLKYNKEENIIAVKVDNSLQPSARWYTGSGINRNVYLLITEQQHFKSFETFIRTVKLTSNSAVVKIDCKVVSNQYPESESVKFQRFPEDVTRKVKPSKIIARLKNSQGEVIKEVNTDQPLSDYSELPVQLEMKVNNPNLWSDKTPYLYTMELQLWVDGKLTNTEYYKIGIRNIEFNSEQGMLVNGQKVIAKGVCLHKDAASFGTAVPKDIYRFRLRKLKALGCNAIRTHGSVDPVFIDLCDEMGFYLMAEAFDEWDKTWEFGYSEDAWGKLPYTYNKFFRQWAETDLKDMVKRDRNHPAVFIYSVGNEVPNQRYADGPKTLKKLINWVKEEDTTRPILSGCDWAPWVNKSGFMDTMDISGYNYPDRYFKNHYQEEHAAHPGRILLGTENYENLENWIKVRDNPYVVGLFLWVGIDYLGEALQWPRRNWEWGLIDIGSFEKSLYYYWQAFWSDKPMVHIAVNLKEKEKFEWRPYNVASHWNFTEKEVDSVFVYSNTEEVELFLNKKSLGKKKVNPDTYQAIYLVGYKKGELEAKAYNKKKEVATHKLNTAGQPQQLKLVPENVEVAYSGTGLIFLTLEVQDRKGIRCPKATDNIEVLVEGCGELVGLDSGDPNSHELYKQNNRKAYEGRLLLTVRPTGKGDVKVMCKSAELKSSVLKLLIEK